tara:strand:+ start:1310 stop:2065 length:756 start_codon:yes stop_codon:yes gene_type:complete
VLLLLKELLRDLASSARDLLPVVLVIAFFQLVVIREPLPPHLPLSELIAGLVFVITGLTLFLKGLNLGLFPVGEGLAKAFVSRGSAPLLLIFGFFLGLGSTFAEPALLAVSGKAAGVFSDMGLISPEPEAVARFQLLLRLTVALAVGCAVVVGILRIIKGWPLHLLVIALYSVALILMAFAPDEIVGIAFDSGGVTTSTITVPLLAALGIGLASTIKGRNPMLDGFGLIAFASVMPIIFVLGFGIAGLHYG